MDGSRGWHGSVKRSGKPSSNWFNTVMGILLLVLAAFGYAVRRPCSLSDQPIPPGSDQLAALHVLKPIT